MATELGQLVANPNGFGEDGQGELCFDGVVHKWLSPALFAQILQ